MSIYFCGGSIHRLDVKRFGLNTTSRIKAFVFRFVSVPANMSLREIVNEAMNEYLKRNGK